MTKKASRSWLVFVCCVLGMPTATSLLPGVFQMDGPEKAVVAGCLLGLAHVCLRPVARLITAALGCLTLGLFSLALDVGLIYGVAHYVDGFAVLSFPYAVVTAVFINIVCFIVSGRK